MNANQLLNMVVRLLKRRVLRGGVNMGIHAASKQMSKGKPNKHGAPTPQQARQQAEATKRAKQSMRALRRFGRF